MSYFKSLSRQRQPVTEQIADEILNSAQQCTDATLKVVAEDFQDEDDSASKATESLYEYVFFLLHWTNRMAFKDLSGQKSLLLCQALVPMVGFRVRRVTTGNDTPFDSGQASDSAFIDAYNDAELEYSKCREVIVDLSTEALSFSRIAAGVKRRDNKGIISRGLVNQLAFNVKEALATPLDPLVELAVTSNMISILKRNKLSELLAEADKECISR